mgnify:CR=1 FL=1
MAKNRQPVAKRLKALDVSPAYMGYNKKTTIRNPKANVRKKQSEYASQLNEKQKVKFVYGILEKQFRGYYEQASTMSGKTGDNLLSLVERRLDNVVYRLGYAMTRREARQMVNHGHITVNGRKVNIPSYQVKPGMVIALKETSRGIEKFKANIEANELTPVPKWLDYNKNTNEAKVVALPERADIDLPIEERLIVELYSK